jgi:hypothetical protein
VAPVLCGVPDYRNHVTSMSVAGVAVIVRRPDLSRWQVDEIWLPVAGVALGSAS